MSNIKKHQKWCKNKLEVVVFSDNKEFSQILLEQLRSYYESNVSKHVAHDLNISLYTVRNWFYKSTGLKAYDLLLLLDNYECVRDLLGFKKIVVNQRLTGKKNRREIRKKILELLSLNPKMTMNELALALEITPKSAEWRLYQLVKEKRIERTGATKNGMWLVRR